MIHDKEAMYPESALYEDINRGTIEISQRTYIFKANHCS